MNTNRGPAGLQWTRVATATTVLLALLVLPAIAQAQLPLYPALTATQPWFNVTVDSPLLGRNRRTVYADSEFGASPTNDDNTLQINAAIAVCKENRNGEGCVVTFREPGLTYKINGGPDGRSINIVNLTDFLFDGKDSTFVFSRPLTTLPAPNYNEQGCTPWEGYEPGLPSVYYGSYFAIDLCLRCAMENIKMDWDWDRYRLANLVKVLPPASNSSWTLEMLEVDSVQSPRDTYAFKSIHTVDTTTNTMGNRNGSEIYVFQRDAPTLTLLGGKQFRLDFAKPNSRTPDVGSTYLLRHFTYEFHAVLVFRANHLTIRNVKIFSCAGKAFVVGRGSSNVRFDRFVMTQPSASDVQTTNLTRRVTCSSDGLFFDSTKGNVIIEDSEIGYHGDDCVNFNSPVSGGIPITPGLEKINDTAIFVRGNRYIEYFPNDTVSLLDIPSYSLLSNNLGTITSAKGDGCGNWTLNFARGLDSAALDRNLSRLIVTNNEYDASKLIVRNLYCHHNRARGILIQGNDVVVMDSRFENIQMGGILIRVHGKEGEGSGTENVLVARNLFKDVDLIAEYNGTAVSVYGKETTGYQIMGLPWSSPRKRNRPGGEAPNRGVSIRDNTIINTPRASIEVSAAQKVLVQNNTIRNDISLAVVPEPFYEGEWKFRGSIIVRVAADVEVKDNIWVESPFNAANLGYIEESTSVNVSFAPGTNYVVREQGGQLVKVAEINVTRGNAYDLDSRTVTTTVKPGSAAKVGGSVWLALLAAAGVILCLLSL